MKEHSLDEVVCLIFVEDGKFLLEERLDHGVEKGDWTTTGGKVSESDRKSDGDYIENASIRESEEETGLTPTKMRLFTSFRQMTKKGVEYIFHGVHVEAWSGELKNDEVDVQTGLARRHLEWIEKERARILVRDHLVDSRIFSDFLTNSR